MAVKIESLPLPTLTLASVRFGDSLGPVTEFISLDANETEILIHGHLV
jgi:hypothetical protein